MGGLSLASFFLVSSNIFSLHRVFGDVLVFIAITLIKPGVYCCALVLCLVRLANLHNNSMR